MAAHAGHAAQGMDGGCQAATNEICWGRRAGVSLPLSLAGWGRGWTDEGSLSLGIDLMTRVEMKQGGR